MNNWSGPLTATLLRQHGAREIPRTCLVFPCKQGEAAHGVSDQRPAPPLLPGAAGGADWDSTDSSQPQPCSRAWCGPGT